METKFKTNFSKLEKIIIAIYIVYVLFIKFVYNKLLLSVIILLVIVIVASMRRNNNNDANYLVKERLELVMRHFILLCILWNIILGIINDDIIYNDSIINIVFCAVLLLIFLLPFSGVFKAISKIKKIDTYKSLELYRDLPQNIEPAIIAYLMQDKLSDKSDMSATLLDLVRREYLILEDDANASFDKVASGILNKKLIINQDKDWNNLKEYERFLVSWFSKTSEKSNEINMNKLKDMLKTSGTFKTNYDKWEQLVKQEANKIEFYDDNSKLSKFSNFSIKWAKKLSILAVLTLVFTIIGVLSEYIVELPEYIYIIFAFSFFVHIALAMLSTIIYDLRLPNEYLNELGNENLRKWNGFIKFLKEYTLIDKRNAEEISIWEEYLVYGVAFGVAKETINTMNKTYGFDTDIKK